VLVDAAAEVAAVGRLCALHRRRRGLSPSAAARRQRPAGSGSSAAAAIWWGGLLQQLDLDYVADGRSRRAATPTVATFLACAPWHRPILQTGKEQIVSALTALSFCEEGDQPPCDRLQAIAETLAAALAGLPFLAAEIIADPDPTGMPVVELRLDQAGAGLSGPELPARAHRLWIEANPGRRADILSPPAAGQGCSLSGRRLEEKCGGVGVP
jgi:hypothetical protein